MFPRRRSTRYGLALGLSLLATAAAAPVSSAAVSVSRAAVSNGTLRLDGRATPNRSITVDGVRMGASSRSGAVRITRRAYVSPLDCTIDVNDGSATPAVATLSGCAFSPAPAPPPAEPEPAAAAVSGLALSPSSVLEHATSTGTVTLSAPAPEGGLEVALTSGNATAASVPASTTVAAGATSGTFTITAGATVSSSSSVITATGGGASRTAILTVNTASPTLNVLSIQPLSVTGGGGATGTVSLTAPATDGGVTVALADDSASVDLPASVTVPAGALTASFPIATSGVAASTSALVSATHGTVTRFFSLALTPAAVGPAVSAVTLSATTVVGGTPVTGTVTLAAAAPPGGSTVVLTSDNTAAATVPPTVTVPAGATRATFPVTTSAVTNSVSSTIVAEGGGARRGATITVTSQFNADNGSLSLARGGSGEGRVVSSPAGIDCTFTRTGTTGRCGNAFFRRGTNVRLTATPLAGSRFQGWEFEVSCRNAPNVTIQAGVAHICRPVFGLR